MAFIRYILEVRLNIVHDGTDCSSWNDRKIDDIKPVDKEEKEEKTVNKDVENFHITTEKIKKKFDTINKVEIEQIEETR